MGNIDSIYLRKNSDITSYDMSNFIPENIKELLYISDWDPSTANFWLSLQVSLDIWTGEFSINNNNSIDPSTLFLKSHISIPKEIENVEKLDYFPNYAHLSNEQRWIYINWLQDITKPIDIGYVFVFYYGLERQLLLGNFDLAFDTIIQLRKFHENKSFQQYSENALIYSIIFKKRPDKIIKLEDVFTKKRWDDIKILFSYKMWCWLTPSQFMDLITSVEGTNKRYIKDEKSREIYQLNTEKVLTKHYNTTSYPLHDIWNLEKLPCTKNSAFCNYSFPSDIRNLSIPSFHSYKPFILNIQPLAEEIHELTKIELKNKKAK